MTVRRFVILLLAMPLAVLGLGALAVAMALEDMPRVMGVPTADGETARHLRDWLRQHHPRRQRDGRPQELRASAADLALLAGQAARLVGGAAQVRLGVGSLDVEASLPWSGHWLNVRANLGDGPDRPPLTGLTVGRLVLPGWMADWGLDLALARWDPPRDGQPPLHHMILATRWQPDQATVVYVWRADLPRRLAGLMLPSAQVERMRLYHELLVERLGSAPPSVDVTALLPPMFALARERSGGGDPVAENRALLTVLAAYALGRAPGQLLPAARGWPSAPQRKLLFGGRSDFPIHFLVSAALAAEGSGPLSDTLGLVKEVSDARGGSGFSFNDIAVNRAGTRLGEMAVSDPLRVQGALAAGPMAAALLPNVADLPEFLTERDFLERYGGVDAPAYRALLADIEARIGALPLYR